MLDHDDREILVFGTREAHNELQLLTLPATNLKEEVNIKPGKKLSGMTRQSKFVAAIVAAPDGQLAEHQLLIATMNGETIRIARLHLDT